MPRSSRQDVPGRAHHVINRGIAKRVCYPDRPAKRRLLSLLGCAVRRGEILVEAFAILDTHCHLLVRSTEVGLAYPMMRVLNAYVRYFNRRFQRDGPLFSSRFFSLPVTTRKYWRAVVRYIDRNPLKAELCTQVTGYPFGSARIYASRAAGPPWLHRRRIEAWVAGRTGRAAWDPHRYAEAVHGHLDSGPTEVIEERVRRGARGEDPLDQLLDAVPEQVESWMRAKARLADGMAPWMPVAAASCVEGAIEEATTLRGAWRVEVAGRDRNGWDLLRCGLLHGVAGLRMTDVASREGIVPSTANGRVRRHLELLAGDPAYARVAADAAARALTLTWRPERT